MKAVLYARVSSKEQEEGFSIPAQLKLIKEYALKNKLKNLLMQKLPKKQEEPNLMRWSIFYEIILIQKSSYAKKPIDYIEILKIIAPSMTLIWKFIL
jgi:hypothetical protein